MLEGGPSPILSRAQWTTRSMFHASVECFLRYQTRPRDRHFSRDQITIPLELQCSEFTLVSVRFHPG